MYAECTNQYDKLVTDKYVKLNFTQCGFFSFNYIKETLILNNPFPYFSYISINLQHLLIDLVCIYSKLARILSYF